MPDEFKTIKEISKDWYSAKICENTKTGKRFFIATKLYRAQDGQKRYMKGKSFSLPTSELGEFQNVIEELQGFTA